MKKFSNVFKPMLCVFALLFVSIACEKKDELPIEKVFISPFSMTIADDAMSVDISYDISEEEYQYVTALLYKADFAKLSGNDASLFHAICKAAEVKGATLGSVDDEFIFFGSATSDLKLWEAQPETEYVLCAVAYDDKMERTSEIASIELTTPAAQDPNFTSVVLSDASTANFVVTVDVTDTFEGNYAIVLAEPYDIEFYEGAEAYAELYLEGDLATYGTDYSVVDDHYVFDKDAVFNISDGWRLSADTEYIVVVFGVEGDGTYAEITTDVVVSNSIRTTGGSAGGGDCPTEITLSDTEFGDIEFTSIEQTQFSYSITPNDKDMPYVSYMFTDEEYTELYPTDEERILAIYDVYNVMSTMVGTSFGEYVETITYPGDYSGVYDDLIGGTTYHVVSFGIDRVTYQPTTVVAEKSLTTVAPPAVTESMNSLTISDIKFDDALMTIDAGTYSGYYHIYPVSKDYMEYYDDDIDAAFGDAIIYLQDIGYKLTPDAEHASTYLFSGSQSLRVKEIMWPITPDTDYYILAGGVDEKGNMTTNVVSSEMFRTAVAPPFELAIDIENITETSAEITLTPNVLTAYYYNNVFTQADVDAGLVDPQALCDSDDFFDSISMGKAVYKAEKLELLPGTQYCVVAFSYDEVKGVPSSELITKSFTTAGTANAPQAASSSVVSNDCRYTTALPIVTPANQREAVVSKNDMLSRVVNRNSNANRSRINLNKKL